MALREIARRVRRDVKGVYTDVHALLQAEVLHWVADDFCFPFDAVPIDLTFQTAAQESECDVTWCPAMASRVSPPVLPGR
jgi:hypothetical protein